MIANMTIAHLSACASVFRGEELATEREKVRLCMGVLKMLGEVWPAGEKEFGRVGGIARGVLGLEGQGEGEGEVGFGVEEGLGQWWGVGWGMGIVV